MCELACARKFHNHAHLLLHVTSACAHVHVVHLPFGEIRNNLLTLSAIYSLAEWEAMLSSTIGRILPKAMVFHSTGKTEEL